VDGREELRVKGREVVEHLQHGTIPPRARPLYQSSVPGLDHFTTEALWGSVWARPGLERRLRMLATVAVLSSLQRLPQLRTYLNSALNIGLDPVEVREVLIQCSVYAGWPTTVNSLELFRDVLEARGIEAGPMDVPEVTLERLEQRGLAISERVAPRAKEDPVLAARRLAPDLWAVELRYVWGELYQRPGLDMRGRATCALAALVALRLEDELEVWLDGSVQAGLSVAEIIEVIMQVAYYAGFPAATGALVVAARLFGDGQPPG
jgi:4-carboxymuconolactone decarboxylase